MGDMADDYDGYDASYLFTDFDVKLSPKDKRKQEIWTTKDGRHLKIADMKNDHLFNAYMMSGKQELFDEMVYRLFESKIRSE